MSTGDRSWLELRNSICKMCTSAGKKQRLLLMFCMTFSFMLTELIVGYCGDSMALVADSFHMLSDVIALVVAFVSILVSINLDKAID